MLCSTSSLSVAAFRVPTLLLLKDEHSLKINAIEEKKKDRNEKDEWDRISTDAVSYCLEGNGGTLSVQAGRGSLTGFFGYRKEVTFLSNLVRTSLACSVWRLPHRKPVKHIRKKRPSWGETPAKSLGTRGGVCRGKAAHAGGGGVKPRLGLQRDPGPSPVFSESEGTYSLLSIFCHCGDLTGSTSLPALSTREPGPRPGRAWDHSPHHDHP